MKISTVMTPCPYTVTSDTSVDEALREMEIYGFQQFPVIQNGELVGLISQGLAKIGRALPGRENGSVKVGELCLSDPFVVHEAAEVAEVAREMAEKRHQCALIADDKEVLVGIFTATDACRLIYMLLEEQGR